MAVQTINRAPRHLPTRCVNEVNEKVEILHKEGKIELSSFTMHGLFPILPSEKRMEAFESLYKLNFFQCSFQIVQFSCNWTKLYPLFSST